MIIVTRYPNIHTVTGGVDAPLAAIISDIRNGYCRAAVERARQAYQHGGKQSSAYTDAKTRLEYFTPGGTFSRRSSSGLIASSGLLQGDIDELTPSQLDYARASLSADPHTAYLFTSPSGAGLKFAFAIRPVADNAAYRQMFDAFCIYIRKHFDFALDEACKSISHPCYLSWDADAYYNPQAKRFEPPKMQPVKSSSPIKPAPNHFIINRNVGDNKLNWACERIANAPEGERHHTRLKIGRLVGGWIAGNLLDSSAAHVVADVAAANSKNAAQARKDIADGLRNGQLSPLYPENKTFARAASRSSINRGYFRART